MKVLVATNSLQNVDAYCYSSHRAEMYMLGRYTNFEVIEWTAQRMSIDRMRNTAAKIALESQCDYLVFIDDDMILSPHTIRTLVESDYDVIMADTRIRSGEFLRMAFDEVGKEEDCLQLENVPDDVTGRITEEGIINCTAVGFAAVALKVESLKQVKSPYFVTGPHSTEDIYYCMKLLSTKPSSKIGIHTKVPTLHKVNPIFVGTDNVEQIRTLYNSPRPTGAAREDRADSYSEAIENL